jgi:hypothetical protein
MLATPSVGSVVSFSCHTVKERDEWLTDLAKILEGLEADYFSLDSEDIAGVRFSLAFFDFSKFMFSYLSLT